MKEFQCIPDVTGLNYEDLCIHPNLNLPEGFKIHKFDTFGGIGNPLGVGRDEYILMRLSAEV